MEIKISEDKLDYLKDIIFDGLGVDKYDSFQSRSITNHRIEFVTPGTRQSVISRYYPDIILTVVNDDKIIMRMRIKEKLKNIIGKPGKVVDKPGKSWKTIQVSFP